MSIGNLPDDVEINQSLRDWLGTLRQQIIRATRPLYIPVNHFSGYYRIVDAADATQDEQLQFAGTGNPVLQEINSLGIIGARIEAVDDACNHLFYVPKYFNVDTNIKFEVVWCTNNNTTTNTATWKVLYNAAAAGEALAAAGTALDLAITADNVLGTYKVAVTPYGLLYGGNIEHGDMLHLKVSLGAVSVLNPAVDQVFLLGILINDEG